MIDRPALEFHLPPIFEANFAINHVQRSMISCFSVSETAFPASVMPEQHVCLLNGHFHAWCLQALDLSRTTFEHYLHGWSRGKYKAGLNFRKMVL